MGSYDVLLLVAGIAALGAAVVPRLLEGRLLSFPLVYLVMGVVIFALPIGLEVPDPREHVILFERLAELAVIIALMGAGLKLDRPVGRAAWATTWRLLAVTMPLTIGLTFLLGWWAIGLAPATAMLVAAALAPTDPVLAADLQVRQPYEPHEDELRFGLTSEAGLNDGLAFPFTNLAILMATAGLAPAEWLTRWLTIDVGYKLVVGFGVGYGVGGLIGDVIFHLVDRGKLSDVTGFVALPATLLVYAATELVGAYGFIAVFVSALRLRHHSGSHTYHEALHDFTEELERLFVAGLLIMLGGAIDAGILDGLTWSTALVAVLLVLVVRPVAGMVGLLGSHLDRPHRLGVAFFGIRGMGSIYYFAHGLALASFGDTARAWALVVFVIVLSVVVHGVTSTPALRRIERGLEG
jgi:sodium/hydrogen antiporter